MSFKCEFCEKSYAYQKNLNLHMRKSHGLEKTDNYYNFDEHKHKCLEGCNISFRLIADLRYHLQQEHGKDMNPELLAFHSMRHFRMWFDNLVKQNNVTYSRGSTTKSGVYYFCNRSGVSRVKDIQHRKRALKKQGSCKIQHSCTSQIVLMERGADEILVKYYKDHYGHSEELQHLRLPKNDVLSIASKIACGISPSRIISETREKADYNNLRRVDLITRKDLTNIRKSLGMKCNEINKKPVEPPQTIEIEETLGTDMYIDSEIMENSRDEIQPPLDVKSKLLQILENMKIQCMGIEDEEILSDIYGILDKSNELISHKMRSLDIRLPMTVTVDKVEEYTKTRRKRES